MADGRIAVISSGTTTAKAQVLEAVRSKESSKIKAVVQQLSQELPARDVREAVRILIEDGSLEVTVDWAVRATR